jgi:hypothetical protein
VSLVAALASLVLRFRRSRGEERQQLKWFTYAGALLLLNPIGGFLPNKTLSTAVFGLLIAFLPVAAGIAILRYRLYDIDRIINRTLVYGLLTALLGAVYAGVVLVLGQVSGGIGTKPPSWAVAGATLSAAALFQPARRRIQQVVDRRFNRRKYNAAKTIQAFSARLRDRSTSVPSPLSWWRWLTRRCSRPGSRSGFGLPQTTRRIHPTVTHGQLPGPTELVIGSPRLCLPGRRTVKTPQRRTTSDAALGQQPGDHGVGVPHLAGPELVSAPNRAGQGVHQLQEPAGDQGVVAQQLGAGHSLVAVGDRSVRPAADLVAEDPPAPQPAAAYRALDQHAA